MTKSLKARLVAYLERRGDFVASGDLQRLVVTTTKHTASNATRRLREAVEEGDLEVEYRSNNGVQHAYYRRKTRTPEAPKRPTVRIEIRDGQPVAVMA